MPAGAVAQQHRQGLTGGPPVGAQQRMIQRIRATGICMFV